MIEKFVIGQGRGLSPEGLPQFAVAQQRSDMDEGGIRYYPHAEMTDLIVAAAIEANKELDLVEHPAGTVETELAREAVLKAATENEWIFLLDTRVRLRADGGLTVVASDAFRPSPGFCPLSTVAITSRCAEELARHKAKDVTQLRDMVIGLHSLGSLQHEAAIERARQEPDEAVVWIRRDGLTVCVAHRGAYLLWAVPERGVECQDIGFNRREFPTEPGFYFFSGKPWSNYPAHWEDYDDGINGTYEALTDTLLERFGKTWDELREDVREYDEELCLKEVPDQTPASPSR